MSKITVLQKEISSKTINKTDYIGLTDIARYKDKARTDYIIQNWLRNRSTIEYLGLWELLNNPLSKSIEFDGFRNQAGLIRLGNTSSKIIDWKAGGYCE